MTICCCVSDCYLQNVAIATLLEVINHSQSLALVIEDKMKRYRSSGHNPFFGKLQMVTLPPIAPGILKVIAEKTDFYQVLPTGKRVVRGERAISLNLLPKVFPKNVMTAQRKGRAAPGGSLGLRLPCLSLYPSSCTVSGSAVG